MASDGKVLFDGRIWVAPKTTTFTWSDVDTISDWSEFTDALGLVDDMQSLYDLADEVARD